MAVLEWPLLTIFFIICTSEVTSARNCASKWKSFGNSCYLFVTPSGDYDPEKRDWKGALTYCKNKGADLVSLTTQDEVQFLYSTTKTLKYAFWIGLKKINVTWGFKRSAWVWSNGDKLNVTRWKRGEPSDHDNENCVEILEKSKYWNNNDCDEKLAWICEKQSVTKIKPKVVTTIAATRKPKMKNVTTTPFISSSTKATASIITSTSSKETTKSTKGDSSDTSSSTMSTSMALFIFLPMILIALIVVIVLLVRKKRNSNTDGKPPAPSDGETDNQHNNRGFARADVGGYTDLHQNREPENAYISLNMYENPDLPYVIENNFNYNNKSERNARQEYEEQAVPYVIPPRPSHKYDIPEGRS